MAAEINYTACRRCGATTITLFHHMTNSNIEVDPLPSPEGSIQPNFESGQCSVVPIKFIKKHGDLWLVHVATCPALQNAS